MTQDVLSVVFLENSNQAYLQSNQLRLLCQHHQFTRTSARILQGMQPLEVAVIAKTILLREEISEDQKHGGIDTVGGGVLKLAPREHHIR